jgi:hypothetical protein
MNFISKILLSIKKFKLIVVFEDTDSTVDNLIGAVLKDYVNLYKVDLPLDEIKPLFFNQKNIVEIKIDEKNKKSIEQALYLIKKSCQSFLIVDKELDEEGFMIMNLIMKSLRQKDKIIIDTKNSRKMNFQGLNIQISDLNVTDSTNFKINNNGDTVPFWFNEPLSNERIKSILLAIATGMMLNLNLVEISQNLKKSIIKE